MDKAQSRGRLPGVAMHAKAWGITLVLGIGTGIGLAVAGKVLHWLGVPHG